MTDTLRTRIAAVLVEVLKSDSEGFVNEYEPCDDDGNPCGATLLRIDSVLDPQALADAVIRELNLATACESGCMWQIPSRFEDMTPQQRKLLERKD